MKRTKKIPKMSRFLLCAAIIGGAFLLPMAVLPANAQNSEFPPFWWDIPEDDPAYEFYANLYSQNSGVEEIVLDEVIVEEIVAPKNSPPPQVNAAVIPEKAKEIKPTPVPIANTQKLNSTPLSAATANVEAVEAVEETEVLESAEIPIISDFEPPVPVAPVIPVIEDNNDTSVNDNRPNGNGSLIEDVNNGAVSRQFITVQSKGGNIFYIVIENDGKKENVYFLNAVDDFDLLSFSENFPDGVLESYEQLKDEAARAEAEKIISEGATDENGNTETPKKSDKTEENPNGETADGGNNSMLIIGVLAVAVIGGAVYFKVIKPKQGGKKNKKAVYDDEEEYEDDEPVNEDTAETSNNDEEDE